MQLNKKYYILFLLLFSVFIFGQITISGKIVASSDVSLERITIINLNSKKATFTDELGYFSLPVSTNDVISISAVHINSFEYQIQASDFSKKLLFIRISQRINQLDEVEIKTSDIDAVSLGILQTPAKKYTVAERRLRTAGDFNWYSPLLIPLGGMPLDGLLNSISGRKKMLQKNLQVERNERDLVKLDNFCDENYYTQNLKIPKEYIKGFQIYALDNVELKSALKTNNKTLTQFLLAKLADNYRTIAKLNP